jgi:hypothetical protein
MNEVALPSSLAAIFDAFAVLVRPREHRPFIYPRMDYRGYLDRHRITPDPKGWSARLEATPTRVVEREDNRHGRKAQ